MCHLIQKSFCLLLLTLLIFLSGCEDPKKSIEASQEWQEEAVLSNGHSLWIKRTLSFSRKPTKFHMTGGVMENMQMSIEIPKNTIAPPPPVWTFNAAPILLDYDAERRTWFIVASYFYCDSWESAGKPVNDQWQYEVQNGKWIISPLNKALLGRRANLYTDVGDERRKLIKITSQEIEKDIRSAGETYRKIRINKPNCSRF